MASVAFIVPNKALLYANDRLVRNNVKRPDKFEFSLILPFLAEPLSALLTAKVIEWLLKNTKRHLSGDNRFCAGSAISLLSITFRTGIHIIQRNRLWRVRYCRAA